MTPTVTGLLAALRQSGLLEPRQLAEADGLATGRTDVADLCRELTRRGWVTLYQLKRLFLGQGADLVLGPYVLLEPIGAGGMGQVFKAHHRRLDRIDALKVIRPELVADADTLARFLREARAAGRLNHPNIVAIYTTDDAGGTHYIAMEYVEGIDLARVVREAGPLQAGQACDYARQAALGLQHAHERGLVHRDVKPANLLVTADASTVKLLDLGLARLHAADDVERSALTQTGVVMGTADYMAPEQAIDSGKVDTRADVYSLGCTLYCLLAGTPPFPTGSMTQKLLWHQQRPPDPLEAKRPDLPAGLLAVVARMLAKNPADRYSTPGEAAQALEPFVALEPLPTPAGPGGQTQPAGELRPVHATSLTVAGVSRLRPDQDTDDDFSFCQSNTGLVWELSLRPAVVAEPPTVEPEEAEPEEAEPAGVNWYAVAGIGGFLVAALALFWPTLAGWFAGPTPREIQRFEHAGPVWAGTFLLKTPDGEQVVTASGKATFLWDAASPIATRRLEPFPGNVLAVAATPGADVVLAGCTQGAAGRTLRRWDLRGKPDAVAYDAADTVMTLAVSPDGKFVVAAGGAKNDAAFPIVVWEVETGVRREAFAGHKDVVVRLAFAPDGKRVASSSLDSTIAVWTLGSPTAELTQKFEHRILGLAWTGDGKSLVLAGENQTLGVYDLATKRWADASGFQGHTHDVFCVAVSPDGTRLVSGSADRTVRLWDLASRRELAVLTGHSDVVTGVAFSPDGRRVLSTSQDRTARLWEVR